MDDLRQIGKLLGVQGSEEMSTAEVLEVLCQIALALLIIFVMANVLFMSKAKAEIVAAKKGLGVLQEKYDKVTDTPKGKLYEELETALIDTQKQKLLLALEKIEAAERRNFGISVFTRKNTNGETEYLMTDIISEGKIINERFKAACILAKETLPDRKKMEAEWLFRVCLIQGLELVDSLVEESIVENPEKISKENAKWLMKEINTRIKAMHTDCCDMQAMALSYLVDYYSEHTDVLMGTRLGKQLDEALSAPLGERARLISQFSRELYGHVKSLFEEQAVPLLTEV